MGFPFKGASTIIDGETLRVIDCEIMPDVVIENRMPGKVIFMKHGNPIVVCGSGLLMLTKVVNGKGESVLPFKRFRLQFH